MVCDTRLRPRQTISERKAEVKKAISNLDRLLASRTVRPKVGPQGGIYFEGWTEQARDGVSDACAYRLLMISGSALAKAEIARAEQIAGRSVSRQALGQGHHSHDGKHWHDGH